VPTIFASVVRDLAAALRPLHERGAHATLARIDDDVGGGCFANIAIDGTDVAGYLERGPRDGARPLAADAAEMRLIIHDRSKDERIEPGQCTAPPKNDD